MPNLKYYLIQKSFFTGKVEKDGLPGIGLKYVSVESFIGHHFCTTYKPEEAFLFHAEAYSYDEVKEWADLLEMDVKKVGI